MTFSKKTLCVLPISALLAACGGTTPVTFVPAATFIEGTTPTSFDPASGSLSVNGVAVTNPRGDQVVDNDDASVFLSDAPEYYSAIARDDDVYAVVTVGHRSNDLVAASFGRTGRTVLGNEPSVTYSGDYAGYFYRDVDPAIDADQSLTTHTTGDVMLNVNLVDSEISGSITNRESYSRNGDLAPTRVVNDVVFSGGTVAANGTFSADATGGEWSLSSLSEPYTTENGKIRGIFGGSDGEVAAGLFSIDTTSPVGFEYTEVGAFHASQD